MASTRLPKVNQLVDFFGKFLIPLVSPARFSNLKLGYLLNFRRFSLFISPMNPIPAKSKMKLSHLINSLSSFAWLQQNLFIYTLLGILYKGILLCQYYCL